MIYLILVTVWYILGMWHIGHTAKNSKETETGIRIIFMIFGYCLMAWMILSFRAF